MDAMALLCNMHADGPATIKLLRRAGYSNLSDVARAKHERLADLLGVSPPYARRFVREARLLADRMGENVLDLEESSVLDGGDGARARSANVGPTEAREPRASSAPTELRWSRDEPVEREPLEPVPHLERAALARRISPAFVGLGGLARSTGTGEPESRRARDASDAEPSVVSRAGPARVLPASGTALRTSRVEGLDGGWCDRLVAQGILTLETLVDAPGMKLAKRLGVPLTELMELQLLAQRRLLEIARERSSRSGESEPTASAAATTSNAVADDRDLDYVIYPPRRTHDGAADAPESFGDFGADDRDLAPRDESDAASFATSNIQNDNSEDVGGPFA